MNLTVRFRELVNSKWVFHLDNDVRLSKEEWMCLVKKHIEQHDNKAIFEKIQHTVHLWNKHDTQEEIALLVYASKYCIHVDRDKEIIRNPYTEINVEMQLSFY